MDREPFFGNVPTEGVVLFFKVFILVYFELTTYLHSLTQKREDEFATQEIIFAIIERMHMRNVSRN